MLKEITINQIITHLVAAKKNNEIKQKICFFLGAGVDLTSGGKLFRKLKFDFVNDYLEPITNNIMDDMLDEKFDKAMDQMTMIEKSRLLNNTSADTINFSDGYRLLILLASKQYVNTVITTNFFDFLERCEEQMKLFPFNIIAPGYVNIEPFYKHIDPHNPIYLKIHGNAWTGSITHVSNEEINNKGYSEAIYELLKHTIQTHIMVFVGYNGYDNKLTEVISEFISSESSAYWITPSEPSKKSKLVQEFEKKGILEYYKGTFDDFVERYACHCFSNDNLSDINPIFILSLIKDKINYQKNIFLKNSTNIIERDIYEEILSSLFDGGNDIFLFGEKGFGKTSIIKYLLQQDGDLIVPIDVSVCNEKSILQQITAILGYHAHIPFSFLYSFCQWCDKNAFTVIFAIDNLSGSKRENNIRFREEFFNFIRAIKIFKYVHFIVAVDNSFELSNIDTLLFEEKNRYQIKRFSLNELNKLFNISNIDINKLPSSYQDMIALPYIYKIFYESQANRKNSSDSLPMNFLLALDALICNTRNHQHDFSTTTINRMLLKLAENEISANKQTIDLFDITSINHLQNLNIIMINDNIPYLQFDVLKYYYVSKFIYSKEQEKQKYISKLYKYFDDEEDCTEIVYQAHLYQFALSDNLQKTDDNLNLLNIISERKIYSKRALKFIKETLLIMLEVNPTNLINIISQCGLGNYSTNMQKALFSLIGRINYPVLKCKLLDCYLGIEDYLLDSFVIRQDSFHNALKKITEDDEFHEQYNIFINSLTPLLQYISCLYQLMLLDPSLHQSKIISDQIIFKIIDIKKMYYSDVICKQNAVSIILNVMKKYSYNILFNSSLHIEEDFAAMSHDISLVKVYNNISNSYAISKAEYESLIANSVDINNMWKFLISNLFLVASIRIDESKTKMVIEDLLTQFDKDLQVQQIDFYLSSVFMAYYEMPGHNREEFVSIFRKLIDKYQMKMFEQPLLSRLSSSRKFTDEFNLIFEDGFNPLAFYFYTATLEQTIDILPIYHELTKILIETGNESKILKIIHALGQMISIMPELGFTELEKVMAHTKHTIIKKGIVRILKEHSIRYPLETDDFIKRNQLYFSSEDKEEIFLTIDSQFENRTFEQLHWSRLLYHLKIYDTGILEKVLSSMMTNENLALFIKEILF